MTTEAQNRATKKYQSRVYDRVMVLLPKGTAERIRATGRPVSGFIAAAAIEALEAPQDARRRTETAPENADGARTDPARERNSGTENARKITIEISAETMRELETYGDPTGIAADALRAIIEEYRAGLR